MAIQVGERIESYIVESRPHDDLQGGIGTVYFGKDVNTMEKVVIKCIDNERDALREAQTLAELEYDNIVHVKAVIRDEPAIVMDYVSGQTLGEYLEHHKSLTTGASSRYRPRPRRHGLSPARRNVLAHVYGGSTS